jgi:3-oxoacyl-[acyl-carrier-protein] synthase II
VTELAITGLGILSSAGIGPEALAAAVPDALNGVGRRGANVAGLYVEPLPFPNAHALVEFDARRLLGHKGTSFLDRSTALALVACGLALEDSGVRVDETNSSRVGITLGTTMGSMKSASDYSRETMVEERPYMVNAVLFPNTVMNCAAGRAAIWYGLKGVNATVAGGQVTFLETVRYALNALRCGHADVLLLGAVEEFTPHTAWATHLTAPKGQSLSAGEGAAVFVVERADEARRSGRSLDGEVLSAITAFGAGSDPEGVSAALVGCVHRALERAAVAADDVTLLLTGETSDEDRIETESVATALGRPAVNRLLVKKVLGECQAASGALQLAAVLALHRGDLRRNGAISMITGRTPDGSVGAAVVRGWNRVGADRW